MSDTVRWLQEMADSAKPIDTADFRNEFLSCATEIERLRFILRINALRWGFTNEEIDRVINGESVDSDPPENKIPMSQRLR